ncbi:glycyl-radical enzyme activating protein [Anaerosalibacter bizertensis]|uniref:Glycyl-radical enzyme activating protein n=1 Tax=Anaerosalibacter bizertensis TaxID=932217 RepID=A0A844FEY8_9FIRM|nr:trans-4-hydroxy-L-proline dehydratase activase [Anaerosalibacter bizertensis]MBV1817059.1 glycyl-radical enzyme activating protein [Bacteroidales bacterium MSK.15.36]MCB5559785.1 glycyl-radical enzyme activating protein [Anaerosalibacter bizertensis]MCG4564823.1 glycyl-radical enzyme activating protein [Anaerosalibacter bizertensis]MCG4582193.1 glycyl-radical enzyme activating protein [Anaerosalibacter bizertensis]MCG4584983.1 glycyl-radical enzyme activating protein [Anaerosalibacter bizer
MEGTIVNIQKYSIHDGPGIRTTVFLKGCPLSCWWCHNPESQSTKNEIMFFEQKCTGCGICVKRCPEEAITMREMKPTIDKTKCILCGNCTDFCYNEAREYVGQKIGAIELFKEIQKDEIFYEESGGGVTFSGGEPLLQVDFLSEVLDICNKKNIHTTLDTSGYTKWENIEKIVNKVDLFLYDLKLIDDEKHKKYIGVSNKLILENLKKLSSLGKRIFVRMPIIAGINDDNDHIDESIKFIKTLNNIEQVNLIPYHSMGMDKYKRLNMDYKLSGMEKPADEKMEELKEKFEKEGIKVKIGG